jgi:hypothetical protein
VLRERRPCGEIAGDKLNVNHLMTTMAGGHTPHECDHPHRRAR